MRQKVERVAASLAEKIAGWPCVEAITLADSAEFDPYDPYFFLSLDVYCRGTVPSPDERLRSYSGAGAFETSNVSSKDRFLLDGLPVRVEIKDVERIEKVLDFSEDNSFVFHQNGTYLFYRLKSGKVFIDRSGWLKKSKEKLESIPDSFWKKLYESTYPTMDHYLSDIGAAVMKEDSFFYLISLAGFLKTFSSILFILNKCFEPSGRKVQEIIWDLPLLPENFKGRYESLLMEDPEFIPSRKREIAELLAKSIINLAGGLF